MSSPARQLIERWTSIRESLIQLDRNFPEQKPLLRRPLLTFGARFRGEDQTPFDIAWEDWRESVLRLMQDSYDFCNLQGDLDKFKHSQMFLGCIPSGRASLTFDLFLDSVPAVQALLGMNEKSIGKLVDEKLRARGHKQEAVAAELRVSKSALGRIRRGLQTPRPGLADRLKRYLDGEIPGFE